MQKEEKSSSTAHMESIMLTSVVYSKEYENLESIDTPNLLIQTPINNKPGEGKNRIKINGLLVDMLVHTYPKNMVPM